MNLERKMEIARQAICSIAEHDDEPVEDVWAALDAVVDFSIQRRAEVISRPARQVVDDND